jgi:hypothetical protein
MLLSSSSISLYTPTHGKRPARLRILKGKAVEVTFARRIRTRAVVRDQLKPGEAMWADFDLALLNDTGTPRHFGARFGRLEGNACVLE